MQGNCQKIKTRISNKHVIISYFSFLLPNNIFSNFKALIFRKMEIVDRLRSEIVCKKWKRVSILYGWRFTRHICLGTVFARRQEYVTSQTINNSHVCLKSSAYVCFLKERKLLIRNRTGNQAFK